MKTIDTDAKFVIEIRRYDGPEVYRFFWVEPGEVSFNHLNLKPFAKGFRLDPNYEAGPNYLEIEKRQVPQDIAEGVRAKLYEQGYEPFRFNELVQPEFRHFVSHSMAPIEFQRGLDSNHPSTTGRVRVWVKP